MIFRAFALVAISSGIVLTSTIIRCLRTLADPEIEKSFSTFWRETQMVVMDVWLIICWRAGSSNVSYIGTEIQPKTHAA